jgi:hypothetical protein
MAARFERGPVGMMTVLPSGPPAMGKAMGLWLVYCLVIGVFVAYLAGRTVAPAASFLRAGLRRGDRRAVRLAVAGGLRRPSESR